MRYFVRSFSSSELRGGGGDCRAPFAGAPPPAAITPDERSFTVRIKVRRTMKRAIDGVIGGARDAPT
jgi:hypothetical protein